EIIIGMNASKSEGGFFFTETQRNHLKNYISLLKLHDPSETVTFDMLLDMYNNPQYVYRLYEQFNKNLFIGSYNDINKGIIKSVDEWFEQNLLPLPKDQCDDGVILYYDAMEEYAKGIRTYLNELV